MANAGGGIYTMIRSSAEKYVEPNEICDGFLSYNPVMKKLYFQEFDKFDNLKFSESIGKVTYLHNGFTELGHKSSFIDNNIQWGYIDNVLFCIVGKYISKDNGIWYQIVIESIM